MSEHAIAQPQKMNLPQAGTMRAGALEHRAVNQSEPTTLPGRLFDAVSSTFMEPRFAHDFSRVRLRAEQPMVQRLPRNERPASAPAIAGPTVWEAPTLEPTAEPAGSTTEATSTPAPAEPTTELATPGETPAPGLLVEDSVDELAPGQMRRSEFLAQLRTAVSRTAEAALAGTGRTTRDCPYLNYWFGYYSRQDNSHIERAIRRYAPETASAATAMDYIPIITQRVRQAVEIWARTDEITGVPEGIPTNLPGEATAQSGGGEETSSGSVMFKAREGGARAADDPQAIQAELGEGRPLEGSVRSRMESAFGMDFAHVRTHTNSTATGLSYRLNARAFTVGEHVAFGANEYKPGTLIGDALIAHELAHVVQQRGASASVAPMQTGDTSYNMLENDADKSAIGAMVSLWEGTKGTLTNIAENAIPRLRSGLRLQRCPDSKKESGVKNKPEAEKKDANGPSAIKIKSKTVATTPADRTRTKVGIGEEADCSVASGGSVTWSVTGGGSVSPVTGPTTRFTGGHTPSKQTVQATKVSSTGTLTFDVIPPNGLNAAVDSNPGWGTVGTKKTGPRTIFKTTVLPTTVSFYNASFRENIPGETNTWPNGTPDPTKAKIVRWGVGEDNVTKDTVSTPPVPVSRLYNGTKFVDHKDVVRVPEEYKNASSKWVGWLPKESHPREYRGADKKARAGLIATNSAWGSWQGPWA